MNKLDQVKHALFTASDYADALAKLSTVDVTVTTYKTYSVIDEFGVLFFPTRKEAARLPLVVTFDCVSPTVTIEQYLAVYEQGQNLFAQQQPDLSQSVPAHDSPVVVEQPVLAAKTPPADILSYSNLTNLNIQRLLREERRLKNSRVKGLSL